MLNVMNFFIVGLGGFLGAILRYGLGLLFVSFGFPWATLIVNVMGCACIAILASTRDQVSFITYLFLVPGFLGAFTTFSAFGLETIKLFQNNQSALAFLNIVLNLTLGLAALLLISRWFLPPGGTL